MPTARKVLIAIAALVALAMVPLAAVASYHHPGRQTQDQVVAAFIDAMKSHSHPAIAAVAAPDTPGLDVERAALMAGDVIAWGEPSVSDTIKDSMKTVTIPVQYGGAWRTLTVPLVAKSGSVGGLRDGWFVTLPLRVD